jgi:hypothetical protein
VLSVIGTSFGTVRASVARSRSLRTTKQSDKTSAEIHDARQEARGRFSGSVAPEDQVGAFAGDGPERSAVRGSYAASGAAAEGSFGNAERDVVVTQHKGEERARVTGRRELKKLLMEAGLDDAAAEADVDALHAGRVLVLVHIAAIATDDARALLDGAAGVS